MVGWGTSGGVNLRLARRRTGDLLLRRALGEIAEIEIARGAVADRVPELPCEKGAHALSCSATRLPGRCLRYLTVTAVTSLSTGRVLAQKSTSVTNVT